MSIFSPQKEECQTVERIKTKKNQTVKVGILSFSAGGFFFLFFSSPDPRRHVNSRLVSSLSSLLLSSSLSQSSRGSETGRPAAGWVSSVGPACPALVWQAARPAQDGERRSPVTPGQVHRAQRPVRPTKLHTHIHTHSQHKQIGITVCCQLCVCVCVGYGAAWSRHRAWRSTGWCVWVRLRWLLNYDLPARNWNLSSSASPSPPDATSSCRWPFTFDLLHTGQGCVSVSNAPDYSHIYAFSCHFYPKWHRTDIPE